MKEVKNLNYDQDLYLDLFLPDKEEFFTIVHFHGGGLVEGDKGDTYQYISHLVKLGFAVATANYSLLPKARFPEYILDASKAIKYVKDNISKYGKSKGIIISGQSAGAYLTLMLCFNKDYLRAVDITDKDIVGYISDSAQPTSHFNILKYEKGLSSKLVRIDETAPLFYVNEDTTFSHLLLMSYEDDIAGRLEQNKLLYATLKNLNDKLDVQFFTLKGWHCHGSSQLDEDGEYECTKIIKEWSKCLD